jgi:hypothetical protein
VEREVFRREREREVWERERERERERDAYHKMFILWVAFEEY